ncbi:hypothetical protein OG271_01305 [Micromonospora rifamycinica]|uniref:hypothetical protein n=1 Tax=Micromonospora rifamycinica TaxID=291594 RepID=UPI002E28CAD9|nr:hypothetical protein [Micromonospora rifamycinica]
MAPVTDPCWIIRLPTRLTSVDEVAALAMALRRPLGHVLAIDSGETTLSEEDRQSTRTRIWCDAPLDGPGPGPRPCPAGHCGRPAGHDGGCPPAPE